MGEAVIDYTDVYFQHHNYSQILTLTGRFQMDLAKVN